MTDLLPITPLRERFHTVSQIAHHCGVSGTTASRWNARGLTVDQADRAATKLGEHPATFWPEWYQASGEDEPDHGKSVSVYLLAAHPEGVERGATGIDLPALPAPSVTCCTCTTCGPCDDLAAGGCDPWCLPCAFDVCAYADRGTCCLSDSVTAP